MVEESNPLITIEWLVTIEEFNAVDIPNAVLVPYSICESAGSSVDHVTPAPFWFTLPTATPEMVGGVVSADPDNATLLNVLVIRTELLWLVTAIPI